MAVVTTSDKGLCTEITFTSFHERASFLNYLQEKLTADFPGVSSLDLMRSAPEGPATVCKVLTMCSILGMQKEEAA